MRVNLPQLFSSFSKRAGPQSEPKSVLSAEFRNRVIFLCQDNFHGPTFWPQIYRNLQYLHGRQILSRRESRESLDDLGKFLSECSDDQFLDFVEMIFQHWEPEIYRQQLVIAVNGFLEIDNLPYAVTDFVWEPSGDTRYRTMTLAEYPRVIRRENQVVHTTAIQPALEFLAYPGFSSANQEFLDALEDYRKADFPSCITKCGSSLESVMKVICHQQGWPYNQNDTAGTLLRSIIPRTSLDSSFEQQLLVVPTVRNRYGNAHGKGASQQATPKHLAQFSINSTASAILLLVSETQS